MSKVFRVIVEIPAEVDDTDLADMISDAAYKWEPEDRNGWDVNVYAGIAETED